MRAYAAASSKQIIVVKSAAIGYTYSYKDSRELRRLWGSMVPDSKGEIIYGYVSEQQNSV